MRFLNAQMQFSNITWSHRLKFPEALTNRMQKQKESLKAVLLFKFRRPGDKIALLPFYGGAKGQSLQIIEKPDGTVLTYIIKTPPKTEESNIENIINPTELENPPLPSKYDTEDFSDNLRKIQSLAVKIIKLQEKLKNNGKLSPSDEASYKENMDNLSESAQKLSELQEGTDPLSIENREGLSAWLENRKSSSKNKSKKKEGDDQKKKDEDKKKEELKRKEEMKIKEEKRKKEEEAQKKNQAAESEKEENSEGEKEDQEGDSETIGIDLPSDDASVAEAKPVGLAVAGVGGVAASKPIATAVVGPGGLAIARPVGTAIAGVDPEQALIPIHAENFVFGSKPPKSGNSEKANEYLSRLISKFHQK